VGDTGLGQPGLQGPYGISGSEVEVTFFVPCYNEETHVQDAVEKLVRAAHELGISHEILVFDDASTDRTLEVVRAYQGQHPDVPLRVFATAVNRGVARNFVEGAFRGRGRYYRQVCGDDVEPLETHVEILRHRGRANIIIPYFPRIIGRTSSRAVLSRFYTVLVNCVSGFSLRYYNGCPLFLRYDVLRFHVEATGFGYQAEFLARLLREGRSYIELPAVARDREGSASLSVRNLLSVAHSLLKIGLGRMRVYFIK